MTDPTPPPAGWYPDPQGPGLKYWDGTAWTEHTRPDPSAPRSQQQPPPMPSSYPGYPGGPGHPGNPGYPGDTSQPGQAGLPTYPGSGQAGQYQPGYYQPQTRSDSNTLSIIGIICGSIAFLFCPILLGPAGIILGSIATSRGERLGKVALGVSVAGLVLGMVIGALVYSSYTYA